MNAPCTLGIRVEPSKIHWAVVEGTKDNPTLKERDILEPPAGSTEPEALAWYRPRVELILAKHSPVAVGVRYPESVGRASNMEGPRKRLRIEGVVVEVCQSKGIRVLTGSLNQIASRLGTDKAKKYLSQDDLRELDWSGLRVLDREAIMAATSALP